MKFQKNEPLKKHNSFRIGGAADYFCEPKSRQDIIAAMVFAKEKKIPLAIIGAGTNLLVRDNGFRGLAIKIGKGLNWLKFCNNKVKVGAGVSLPRLIKACAAKGLGGIEFLAGIPGSAGGAVVMNAGAWGKAVGKFVNSVNAIDYNGKERLFSQKELQFAYRSSRFQKEKWIIIEITLQLNRLKRSLIKNKVQEYQQKRRARQPLGIANCGSVFKNPKGDFAGRIIEAAGCKGLRIGDAQVSDKHANFIVNLGEAKAKDVIKLMTQVQKKAKTKLEPEIKLLS